MSTQKLFRFRQSPGQASVIWDKERNCTLVEFKNRYYETYDGDIAKTLIEMGYEQLEMGAEVSMGVERGSVFGDPQGYGQEVKPKRSRKPKKATKKKAPSKKKVTRTARK